MVPTPSSKTVRHLLGTLGDQRPLKDGLVHKCGYTSKSFLGGIANQPDDDEDHWLAIAEINLSNASLARLGDGGESLLDFDDGTDKWSW